MIGRGRMEQSLLLAAAREYRDATDTDDATRQIDAHEDLITAVHLTDYEGRSVEDITNELVMAVNNLETHSKIEAINLVRKKLHDVSPFKNEPVDCVEWVRMDDIEANDYNPNAVAPPEMKLLEVSIVADGYTQPIVADYDDTEGHFVVVDGFHRHRVGRESETVNDRVLGYLPLVQIRPDQTDRPDRIASTIRHNRARGKHQVEQMSNIVLELKRRNWSDKKIGKELGMDPDEVLRLAQITGLAEAFKDHEFSKAWTVDLSADDTEIIEAAECIDEDTNA